MPRGSRQPNGFRGDGSRPQGYVVSDLPNSGMLASRSAVVYTRFPARFSSTPFLDSLSVTRLALMAPSVPRS